MVKGDPSLVEEEKEGQLRTRSAAATAAAAKSLQPCWTLCEPIDGSPSGSTVPGILQARTLEWAAIFFSNAWKWKVKVKSLSRVRLFMTPWTAAYQAPLSMRFSQARVLEWVAIAGCWQILVLSDNFLSAYWTIHQGLEHPSFMNPSSTKSSHWPFVLLYMCVCVFGSI